MARHEKNSIKDEKMQKMLGTLEGLATDGFNPFGNMNNSYSMWPVFVVSYNMPPWVCMEESNFMMALLISRPSSPRDFVSSWNLSSKSCSNFGSVSGQPILLRVKDLNCVLWFFGAYMIIQH
jgi:hypothetical protein